MKNVFLKICLMVLVIICVFPYAVFGANIDGYDVISGKFKNMNNGFYIDTVDQMLILNNDPLIEGKISAEFSKTVIVDGYQSGIFFAGNGLAGQHSIVGNNISYLFAAFDGYDLVLINCYNYNENEIKRINIDKSIINANETIKLSVTFDSTMKVSISVNDVELINLTDLNGKIEKLYGGEFGVRLWGIGYKIEITNLTATSLSHTEHTAGEIIGEISANCMSNGTKEHSVCTVCGELIYKKDGVWTIVTEEELAITKDPDNHIDKTEDLEWEHDENGHKKSCRCGKVLASGEHDINSDALEGTCTICGYDKVHNCSYTPISAVPADCITNGKKEHYKCEACGKLYKNGVNKYVEISESELLTDKDSDNHIDSADDLAWVCYDTNEHRKVCRCGEVFKTGKHDISSSALEGECSGCGYIKIHTCVYTEVPEKIANCKTKGEKAHYTCSACKKLYIQIEGEYLEVSKDDLVIPKDANNHVDSVDELSWTYDTKIHKKTCGCGKVIVSEEHDIDVNALEGTCTICGYAKIHNCTYKKVSAATGNCMTKGTKEHYKCNTCEKLYLLNGSVYVETNEDELKTSKDPSKHIDSTKNLAWVGEESGHKKTCSCGTVLSSGNHDIAASALEGTCTICGYNKTHTCTYTKVSATPADCMTKGEKEHYKCEACGKLYTKSGSTYTVTTKSALEIAKDPNKHADSTSTLPWTHDASGHKKTCRCGKVLASGNHDIAASAISGTCTICGYSKIHTCTYTKVSATPADCMTKGEKEHYKCNACSKLYIKNGSTYVITTKSALEIDKDPNKHIDSTSTLPWTHDASGHKKTCRCGKVLASGNHDIAASAISGTCTICGYSKTHTCTYTKISATPADCMTKGEKEHYKCEACGKLYIKSGTTYTVTTKSALEIAKDPSKHADSTSTLPWTHDASGHKKTCRCGKILASGAHDIATSAISGTCTICGYSKTHTCTYTKISATPADCMTKGEKEHYKCNACGKLYIKSGSTYTVTTKSALEVAKDPSKHIDSTSTLPWTHDASGHKKTCRCGKVLASGNHDIAASALEGTCTICGYSKIHTCTYTKISATPADCMTKGEKEHYKCNACSKLYIKNGSTYVITTKSALEIAKDPSKHVDNTGTLTWTHDASGHKKTCRCGKVLASGAHDIQAGAIEGICTVCGYDKTHICEYTFIPATVSDCVTVGEKEHYKCSACQKIYVKNGNIYVLTTKEELSVDKDTSNHIDTVNALPWSYVADKHIKTCRCGTVIASGAHDIASNALEGKCTICAYEKIHICEYTYVGAKPSDCVSHGVKEHYACTACKKLYQKIDEVYILLTKEDVELAKDHDKHIDSADSLPWEYDKNGHTKTCRCGALLALGEHDIEGNKCTVCGYEKEHECEYTFVSGKSGSCSLDGIKEHYECLACGNIYLKTESGYVDADPEDIVIRIEHILEKYDAVSGDCMTNACDRYWECKDCGKLFSDENAENEIDSVPEKEKDSENHVSQEDEWIIEALKHFKECKCGAVLGEDHIDGDGDGKCDICEYSDPEPGDDLVYYIVIISALLILAACIALVMANKKLFVK